MSKFIGPKWMSTSYSSGQILWPGYLFLLKKETAMKLCMSSSVNDDLVNPLLSPTIPPEKDLNRWAIELSKVGGTLHL